MMSRPPEPGAWLPCRSESFCFSQQEQQRRHGRLLPFCGCSAGSTWPGKVVSCPLPAPHSPSVRTVPVANGPRDTIGPHVQRAHVATTVPSVSFTEKRCPLRVNASCVVRERSVCAGRPTGTADADRCGPLCTEPALLQQFAAGQTAGITVFARSGMRRFANETWLRHFFRWRGMSRRVCSVARSRMSDHHSDRAQGRLCHVFRTVGFAKTRPLAETFTARDSDAWKQIIAG